MLKVSGLQLSHLSKSENSDQVRKFLKYVADILRKIDEKHQVRRLDSIYGTLLIFIFRAQREWRMCSVWS